MDITKQNNNLYRNLIAYRKAVVIYDLTYHFCERFIAIGDRTKDQMVQAARSGKQNIVEGKAYIIEVNSIPGMSSGSIVPKQARTAGISLGELYDKVIEDTMA